MADAVAEEFGTVVERLEQPGRHHSPVDPTCTHLTTGAPRGGAGGGRV